MKEAAPIVDLTQWKPLDLNQAKKDLGFYGVYVSFFGVVGVVVTDIRQVIACWMDCQAAMIEFNKTNQNKSEKDSYLIFIVPTIHEDCAQDLEAVLSDTYVCRKICIERGSRSIADAIRDCGLMAFHETRHTKNADILNEIIGKEFPQDLIKDLIGRSPETIIQKIISGQYKSK